MSRPGRSLSMEYPATPTSDSSERKTHIQDVELKERSSKSLLANVLDIDDDFRHNCRPLTPGGTLPHNPTYFRTVYRSRSDSCYNEVSHKHSLKGGGNFGVKPEMVQMKISSLLDFEEGIRKEDEDSDIAKDWKFAAMPLSPFLKRQRLAPPIFPSSGERKEPARLPLPKREKGHRVGQKDANE
ncbi:nicotinic acetylcholine receptor subunit [Culex quinquefasciatus]|uniref:Nicotinic acetylcholine receptor subunit n=1 Tax=Culex quinquefasciatus TaxID=7176 RepID=B0X969_CULQU|nr:nicotinic acetylcholine receptor subunit [Culex quinquefasciatus]|eukprot:XP_001866191.1 nicotinic acetylcholine receptor subunit [Culex quinquefasciatus]